MNSQSSNKCLLWKVWCWFFINNLRVTHYTLHSTFSAVSDVFIPWRWPHTGASVWIPLHRRSPCTRCSNRRRPRLRPLSSGLPEAGTEVKISTFTRTSVLCSLCAIHQPFWASHWSSRSSSSADRVTFFTLVICNTTSAAELHSTHKFNCVFLWTACSSDMMMTYCGETSITSEPGGESEQSELETRPGQKHGRI